MSEIILEIGNVPVSPDANKVTIYPKSDKRIYIKDENGVEVSFSPPATTDALNEGTSNLYFTNDRAKDAAGDAVANSDQVSFQYDHVAKEISANLVAGGITDIEIASDADISLTKLDSVLPSRAIISNGLGKIDVSPTTETEISFLSGVLSPLQAQIDGKYDQPTGNTSQYIRGDGSLAVFPTLAQADKLVTTVKNQTGSLIPAGSVVYINGSSGNDPTITLALADNDTNSAKTYGLTATAIADNSTGLVVASGRLQNINTSGFLAGASLWLSPTTPGGYTTTKPQAPDHIVAIGFVIRSHPTQGEIEVKIINGFELDELHDVRITAPATGQSIFYDTATQLWSNQTPPMSLTGQMSTSFETAVVALTDAPTIPINAALGNTFTVTLGGNRTLGTPTNPVSGQKIIVRVTQDGVGGRQLSYSSGWALGIDFVGLPLSTSPGVTDYIGAIYNTLTSKWDVVSIMRGY